MNSVGREVAGMEMEVEWAEDANSDARVKEGEKMKDEEMSNTEPDGPPDGFQFVLPFLDLLSRLNVERLNKPLREAVQDPLVWVDLMITGPACRRLTNEILLKLVKRADGHLKSLFLVDALWISDATLSRISELNPGLEKISVPGCTRLKVENFVSLVEAHSLRAREKGLPGISQVRLRGLYNISPEHLRRLEKALGLSGLPQNAASLTRRRYYGNEHLHSEATDKRPVDVELCPECQFVRLIYDCTKKHRVKEDGCSVDSSSEDEYLDDFEVHGYTNGKPCRSCSFCIPRCEECGTCIRLSYFEESLCRDLVCDRCWSALPKCDECNLPACSRHEAEYFPEGADICSVCSCLDIDPGEDVSPNCYDYEPEWEY